MMPPELVLQRAADAERLTQDPTLIAAFKELEDFYTAVWQDSKASQGKERETLWLSIQALRGVQSNLNAMVQTGKVLKDKTLRERIAAALTGK